MHREAIPCTVEGQPCYRIPVGKSNWALIDAADLELVSQHKWRLSGGYVCTNIKEGGKSRTITMHRLIHPSASPQLDHEDNDPCNNRRGNLREVTHAQNQQNRRGASSRSSTGVRNVYFQGGSYLVRLGVAGKVVHVGSYPNLELATAAAKWARSVYFTHAKECDGKRRPLPRGGAYCPDGWTPSGS
jgi:hypothetical protein